MTRIEWLGVLALTLVIIGLVGAPYGGGYAWLAFSRGWAAGCLTVVIRRELAKHRRDQSTERFRGDLRDIER